MILEERLYHEQLEVGGGRALLRLTSRVCYYSYNIWHRGEPSGLNSLRYFGNSMLNSEA